MMKNIFILATLTWLLARENKSTDDLSAYKQRRGIMSYAFAYLTFNWHGSIVMSHDLARAIQRLRDRLGPGNIVHSGVYRRTPKRISQHTGEEIPGPPWTGHYFWDAIDIKSWGDNDIYAIADSASTASVPFVLEPRLNIIHLEVNRPHMKLERK